VPRKAPLDQAAIHLYLHRYLPSCMVPSSIVGVSSIPTNHNGKVDRAKLQAMHQSDAVARHPCGSELLDRVSAIWCEVLDLPHVAPDESFFELGGDSLSAALLVIRLEQEFKNAPSLSDLLEHPTIARLTQLLSSESAPKKQLIARLQPDGDRSPLFCIPGADGQLLVFRHFTERIGTDQPVFGVPPCGLEGAEPNRTIEEIAARAVGEIRSVRSHGPYRLAGFSAGGVVAFEMARQLQAVGEPVSVVLLIDSFPGLPPSNSLMGCLLFHLKHLASLPAREWGPQVQQRAKVGWIKMRAALRGAPREQRWAEGFKLSPNATRVALANLDALRAYRFQPSPINAVLLRASIQPYPAAVGEDFGWKKHCQAGFKVATVPGTHIDCLGPRHIETFVRTVRTLLDQSAR
jgi:thioesterase domain-containing protein/acyl carrier protein